MRSITKLLAGLLTLVLMLFLVACGGDSSEPSTSESNNKTETNETSESTDSSDDGSQEASIDYPTKPIQVVVPAGAGGDTDRNTRALARHLEEVLGQTIVVNNVTGSGGTIGSRQVLDADPDGYTVLAFHDSILINNILGLADFSFADFTLAGVSVTDDGNAFLVSGDSQFDTLTDFVEYGISNPNEISVATEVGAFTHLQLLALEQETGASFNIVDVGGAADKVTALLGGHIDMVPTQLGLVKDYIETGDMKSLGILASDRLPEMPDIPTFKDQGVNIEMTKTFFWAFPPGTPEEIVNTFSAAIETVVTTNQEFQDEASSFVITPNYLNPEETLQHLQEKEAFYRELYESIEQ